MSCAVFQIANVYFDPGLQCGNHCYAGLPFLSKCKWFQLVTFSFLGDSQVLKRTVSLFQLNQNCNTVSLCKKTHGIQTGICMRVYSKNGLESGIARAISEHIFNSNWDFFFLLLALSF